MLPLMCPTVALQPTVLVPFCPSIEAPRPVSTQADRLGSNNMQVLVTHLSTVHNSKSLDPYL